MPEPIPAPTLVPALERIRAVPLQDLTQSQVASILGRIVDGHGETERLDVAAFNSAI